MRQRKTVKCLRVFQRHVARHRRKSAFLWLSPVHHNPLIVSTKFKWLD
jgi:hypothetical protein